jgi:hypothetical protein
MKTKVTFFLTKSSPFSMLSNLNLPIHSYPLQYSIILSVFIHSLNTYAFLTSILTHSPSHII